MKPVEIQVAYDFICPWCWIGHSNLKSALAAEKTSEVVVIEYVPFELNPSLPEAGVNRKKYRTTKFGSWHRSLAMDADVTAAGRKVGLDFHYDRVAVTPNTLLAHRLMVFAERKGDAAVTAELFDAIFAAYFSRGENIGLADVLVKVAVTVGLDGQEVRKFLAGDEGKAEVVAKELEAQSEGVRGVPLFRIGEAEIQGAQPVSVLLDAIETASTKAATSGQTGGAAIDCSDGSCAIAG